MATSTSSARTTSSWRCSRSRATRSSAPGSHAVALELGLTEALLQEGVARELVHAIQGERRDAGLDVSDRIHLELEGDADTIAAARTHEEYIAGEVLATTVALSENGTALRISVSRA